MKSFHVHDILKATKGSFLQEGLESTFCGISIDSRTLREGELFIAILGKRFDGHDFVREAIHRGAQGILISKEVRIPSKTAVISVPDTLTALGAIARYHRRQFSLPVIGVTGSNGKTTTKEMIAHILSGIGPVLKNEGTKNNPIGVPLTLLQLAAHHRFAVLELGMSERGEIGSLSRMVAPTTGVITNIGPAHLTLLKDLKTVFSCKMEVLEGLGKGGALVLNGEDPYLKKVNSPLHRIVFFGKGSAFCASDIREKGTRTLFRINRHLEGSLPLVGGQHVDNLLAAIAVARCHGVEVSLAIERLRRFRGCDGRMTLKKLQGVDFIDDTYNANPESARRALESFRRMPTKGKRIFIMGDMLELGEAAHAYHVALGEHVASSKIDLFMTVGELSRSAHEKASACGMNGHRVQHFESAVEAGRWLFGKARAGDRILVKGSRAMKMEDVIKIFEGS